jgi:hypothetical protein
MPSVVLLMARSRSARSIGGGGNAARSLSIGQTALRKSGANSNAQNAHVAIKEPFRGGIWEGGGKNELICSFSLGKVVEAAGVETKVVEFSNWLMARDF